MSAIRHRRRRRRGYRSLLFVTPVIATLAIVVTSVVTGAGHDGSRRPGPSRTPSTAASLSNGWYSLHPVGHARGPGCLSIFRDESLKPFLVQDDCDGEDPLQRLQLVRVPAYGQYVIRSQGEKELECLSLDSTVPGSPIHLRRCQAKDQLQHFEFVRTGSAYQLRPAITAEKGLCVGIDAKAPGKPQAVNAACPHAGIEGFALSPASAPNR